MTSVVWSAMFRKDGKRIRSTAAILMAMLTTSSLAWSKDAERASSQSSPLHLIQPQSPQGLRQLLGYDGEPLYFVSAHRGGAREGFPENCIATFENTLQHTFAIMEIDPRYTKDGAIVLHHDATLERTTPGKGCVAEQTLQELKKLRLKDTEGIVTDFEIPTLDEVLEWARGKTILVLDQKDVPVEARVRKVEEHQAEGYAILIVYTFKAARQCYELNKNIMMEIMIPDRKSFQEFDDTGIPWSNVIAFVGHKLPADVELLRMIHAKGTCCMAGTSRNLDTEFALNLSGSIAEMEQRYRALLHRVDVIETNLPAEVGGLLYGKSAIPASKSKFFRKPSP